MKSAVQKQRKIPEVKYWSYSTSLMSSLSIEELCWEWIFESSNKLPLFWFQTHTDSSWKFSFHVMNPQGENRLVRLTPLSGPPAYYISHWKLIKWYVFQQNIWPLMFQQRIVSSINYISCYINTVEHCLAVKEKMMNWPYRQQYWMNFKAQCE